MESNAEENVPLDEQLGNAIRTFLGYFREVALGEIGIRVGVYILLVVLVHTFYIQLIYQVLIPMIQTYMMDSALDEFKERIKGTQIDRWGMVAKKKWDAYM